MALDLTRISGSCAECLRDDVAGPEFIYSQLQRFLAERKVLRGSTDVRGPMLEGSRTQVGGETLRCRRCVVKGRDLAAGLEWGPARVALALAARPFGLVRVDNASSYIISRAEGAAAAAGVGPGWRVVVVGDANVGGESCETVREMIKAARLPLSIVFQRPAAEWPPCSRCGDACQPGRSSCMRGLCVAAEEAAPAASAEQSAAAGEVADSWEDDF